MHSSLLSCFRNESLLGRMVTGDEKWIIYKHGKYLRKEKLLHLCRKKVFTYVKFCCLFGERFRAAKRKTTTFLFQDKKRFSIRTAITKPGGVWMGNNAPFTYSPDIVLSDWHLFQSSKLFEREKYKFHIRGYISTGRVFVVMYKWILEEGSWKST